MTGSTTITTPSDREIRTERVFNAGVNQVWRAFTEPQLLAQWWGRGNKLTIERYEFERGGHWRFVEHSAQGVDEFEGRFRELNPPRSLTMTFEWDGMPGYVSLERCEFEPLADGRSKVITTSRFFTTEERDGMLHSGMEEGLNQSYEALDRVLENSQAKPRG